MPAHPDPVLTPPRLPDADPPAPFPLLATVAPVLASALAWWVTRSPLALAFAAMGPLLGTATWLDARRRAARTLRHRRADFAAQLAEFERQVADAHGAERDAAAQGLVDCGALARGTAGATRPWRPARPPLVRIGEGEVPSEVRVERAVGTLAGVVTGRAGRDPVAAERRVLAVAVARASRNRRAVVADATDGISVVGGAVAATSVARALVVQLAAILPPDAVDVAAPVDPAWAWLSQLPHRVVRDVAAADRPARIEFRPRAGRLPPAGWIEIVHRADARAEGATVVRLDGLTRAGVEGTSGRATADVEVGTLTLGEAERAATTLGSLAPAAARAPRVPTRVELADLVTHGPTGSPASTVLGRSARGDVAVALAEVAHVLVAGTTGSGKSELLLSWVVSACLANPPDRLAFVLVDFKGGATFDALASLPHVVGVLTDLDASAARRALDSLAAEVRRRERELARAGLRSIDAVTDGAPFARLVIVIDEYAALVDQHDGLHPLFTDLASRGRSLGIHLVIGTQRPAGVVRESIIANCGARICLRVASRADSVAVLGSDDAASLSASDRGRAILAVHGEESIEFQVARTSAEDLVRVRDVWREVAPAVPPWCPPLPSTPGGADLAAARASDPVPPGAHVFGLRDLPDQQRIGAAWFDPAEQGCLVVVGGAGSGKTTVLAAMGAAAGGVAVRPGDAALLWDALGTESSRLLLLDDVDVALSGADTDTAQALAERLAQRIRRARGGLGIVIALQRVPPALGTAVALAGPPLVLATPTRAEHLLAGGAAADWVSTLPPGRGTWRGRVVQSVASRPALVGRDALLLSPVTLTQPLAVVARQPDRVRALLAGHGIRAVAVTTASAPAARPGVEAMTPEARPGVGRTPPARTVRVGTPEEWAAQWGALPAAAAEGQVVYDGVSASEARNCGRWMSPPPPWPGDEHPVWLSTQGTGVTRASWPAP